MSGLEETASRENTDNIFYMSDHSPLLVYGLFIFMLIGGVIVVLFLIEYLGTENGNFPAKNVLFGPITVTLAANKIGGGFMLVGSLLFIIGLWFAYPSLDALNNARIRSILGKDVDFKNTKEMFNGLSSLLRESREQNSSIRVQLPSGQPTCPSSGEAGVTSDDTTKPSAD